MTIVEQRFLRGPNLWSRKSCLMTVAELGDLGDLTDLARSLSTELPGFAERLHELVPTMRELTQPLLRGAFVAEVIGQLTLELQRLAGAPPDTSFMVPVHGERSQVKIIVAYALESVAQQAFDIAVDLVRRLCAGEHVDLGAPLLALQATAQRGAIGASTTSIVNAAHARGIPVIRLSEQSELFQLGWGSRQKRIDGTLTGMSRAPEFGLHALSGNGAAVVEAMFGDGDGRIPVIAVTGTNGKTTTSLMIEHSARLAGLATGVTTTEGVYIKGQRITDGDCSGYHSARELLTSSEVEFAVLETARGGILKRGLAFDYCTVAVVLNVSADHLGLDGIDTIAELARVKAVVALAASRAVVLNADDQHCVAMGAMLGAQIEPIWFAMDPDNQVLLRHLANNGRAAWFEGGTLMVGHGALRSNMLAACAMPAAMQGHARYNVANGLAAACALMAVGLSLTQIAAGLASFVSDAGTNPLRSNVYAAAGVTIVVDYAHNPAAYAALSGMARSLTLGRRVAVITSPGDRRTADLRDIGATCAAGFDELIVYEADPRGRALGETAAIILAGARDTGKDESMLHAIVPVADAFDAAMARCAPGDVLVFACGSQATAQLQTARYVGAGVAAPSRATMH